MTIDLPTALRLLLLFSHLLLCVFALQLVLQTDLRVLRGKISARGLTRVHRRVVRLLLGLWLSGALLVLLDQALDPTRVLFDAKLVAKLACVLLLTVNGVLIGRWCLPRVAMRRPLGHWESAAVMVAGAVSTCSWLMAAFFGIAKPLKTWPVQHTLALYGVALGAAVVAALVLNLHRRRYVPSLPSTSPASQVGELPAADARPA